MTQEQGLLNRIRRAAGMKILFLPHALQQMLRPDRMINRVEIRQVIEQGEVIEDYPTDTRGHSCLLLGTGVEGRSIHVVCAPKEDYLAVITAYLPNKQEWTADFRKRVKR